MKAPESYQTFEEVKTRLDEIVQAVSDESLPFDEALNLYEEAVKLGTRASMLIEEVQQAAAGQEAGEDADADGAGEGDTAGAVEASEGAGQADEGAPELVEEENAAE